MKKTIPFELFGPNQFLMFDILRLEELENAMGCSIDSIAAKGETGVRFCLAALPIAMKQHYKPNKAFFVARIQEHLDNGGTLTEIAIPLIQAIRVTGLYGTADLTDDESGDEEEKNGEERTETEIPKQKSSTPSANG